ncbi:MAG: glycoside hydrolase family 97 protein [Bacteroidia bacterium]|nr:MAG: glycoside hydrolase family 97 protein [Bacteroidia bacterium]
MKAKFIFLLVLGGLCSLSFGQKSSGYAMSSPDGSLTLLVQANDKLQWSVTHRQQQIIDPSAISLQLGDGSVLGDGAKITSSKVEEVNTSFQAINYKKAVVSDHCNQLTLKCKGGFGIIFRVYNDAVAYRFYTAMKGEIVIKDEEANFNFTDDHQVFIPYMWDYRDGKIFNCSFEALYTEQKISEFRTDSLAFLPLLVDVGQGKKAVILEADLEDYPGMFMQLNETGKGYKGVFAPYPLEEKQVGINYIPVKRAEYIAQTQGTRQFPWRGVIISQEDKDLLNNDLVQKLASPNRIEDTSWIKAGQVAWDWWSAKNISHVDFEAGTNTETYLYYIDFAAANGIPYIILDGGWSDFRDLTKTRPEIDLPAIVEHGDKNGVGVILWAGWHQLMMQLDEVFSFYADLGIKGFKIDFIDRDDQLAVASTYEMAKKAADHHLLLDYHGIFKPTGLQRTYPNIVGYEGVKGMENVKWAHEDVPRYDVSIPFIRMLAGPMDYTPGAMRNASRRNFAPINANPMSQGTRCHQLAMYVIFEAPLQMLSDNPTAYMKEQACTDYITQVPVAFDETLALDGKVAEYVAIARRKGDTWYIGAMTNWDPRDLTIHLSFLAEGEYEAVIFKDGINAHRQAADYSRVITNLSRGDTLEIHLSSGGGWTARLEKKN